MTPDKVRDLSDDELVSQQQELLEKIFRLRFRSSVGQAEGTQKIREFKKDVARIKTIQRERQLSQKKV